MAEPKKIRLKNGETRYKYNSVFIGTDRVTGVEVRKSITASTKKEAKDLLRQAKNEFEANGFTTKKKTSIKTFGDLIDQWLIKYEKESKDNSVMKINSMVKAHIRPLLGEYRLDKLTTSVLQIKVNEFAESTDRKDYKTILAYVKKICRYGLSLDCIASNPMDRVDIPNVKKTKNGPRKVKSFTKIELRAFYKALEQLPDDWANQTRKLYYELLDGSGIRANEGLALNWSDIDFGKGHVTVNKTIINNTGIVQDSPKTASSNRTVRIGKQVASRLKAYQKAQFLKRGELGQPKSSGVIFCDLATGKHLKYQMMRNNFKKLCQEAGIPYHGLHCLRHTYATMWIAGNPTKWKELQAQLGHESLKETMDTYSHALEESIAESIENRNNFIAL